MTPSRLRAEAAVVAAMVRRDFTVARSYRAAYVLEAASAILGIAIYYFISRTFANTRGADLGDAPDYFSYAVVGVVLTMVIHSAAIGLSRRMREEQLTGTFEAVTAQPIAAAQLGVGMASYPFLWSGFRAAVYLVVADLLLGVDFSNADVAGAVLTLLATTVMVFGLGLAITALVVMIKRAEVVVALTTTGLAMLGGAYFPISVLPDWIEPLAEIVPTRLAYDGMRAALYAGEGWVEEAAILAGLSLVAIPVGLWLFSRSLAAQRRRGTLGEY